MNVSNGYGQSGNSVKIYKFSILTTRKIICKTILSYAIQRNYCERYICCSFKATDFSIAKYQTLVAFYANSCLDFNIME